DQDQPAASHGGPDIFLERHDAGDRLVRVHGMDDLANGGNHAGGRAGGAYGEDHVGVGIGPLRVGNVELHVGSSIERALMHVTDDADHGPPGFVRPAEFHAFAERV